MSFHVVFLLAQSTANVSLSGGRAAVFPQRPSSSAYHSCVCADVSLERWLKLYKRICGSSHEKVGTDLQIVR